MPNDLSIRFLAPFEQMTSPFLAGEFAIPTLPTLIARLVDELIQELVAVQQKGQKK